MSESGAKWQSEEQSNPQTPDWSNLNLRCYWKDIPHAAVLGQVCNQSPAKALVSQIFKSTSSGLRGQGSTGVSLYCRESCHLV